MCGRFTHHFTWAQIHRILALSTPSIDLHESYNVAPTQLAPVVRMLPEGRTISLLRWGLIPSWANDAAIGNNLINARAEGVATKPTFRDAFAARRCVVPANGFFEWRKAEGGKKQPYYIHPSDEEPFLFAGLWESWVSPDGEVIETFAIITTDANAKVAELHDRMPVILDRAGADKWLNPATPREVLQSLLKPCPPERVTMHPVSTAMNSPAYNAPDCVAPTEALPLARPARDQPTLFEI